jgi:hypothetical protein
MYPFMTLNDWTEIVHSERKADGSVKVYFEKPDAETCFRSAVCWLPAYRWEDVNGFTTDEIAYAESVVRSTAHLIMEFSEIGGFDNASGF